MIDKHLVKPKIKELNERLNQPQFASELFGLFKTVTVVPTATPIPVPRNYLDQIQIYTNGATLRLYWYDVTNNTWHYVSATA